jgi:hypothetical protein
MLDLSRVASVLRQVAAIAAMVVGSLNQIDLPSSVRVILVAAGGVLLTLEHLLAGLPNTTTPPHATTTVTKPTGLPVTTITTGSPNPPHDQQGPI